MQTTEGQSVRAWGGLMTVGGEPVVVPGGQEATLMLVSPYEVRLRFKDPQKLTDTIWGTIEVEGATTQPIPLLQTANTPFLSARLPVSVTPPVKVGLQLYSGHHGGESAQVTLTGLESVENRQFSSPASADQAPQLTTASVGLKLGEDVSVLGVKGSNLANAQLFLRQDGVEQSVPLDVQTDTSLGVLDEAIRGTLKPGTWDVVVRTPAGQAVLPKAIVLP